MIELNEAQSRHLANSLRALGLGQFAAFGYVAFQSANWWTGIFFAGLYGIAELAALRLLNDVEETS